jgi:hypothetical protein
VQIKPLFINRFEVVGTTGTYQVNTEAGSCSCPSKKFRPSVDCKHLKSCRAWLPPSQRGGQYSPAPLRSPRLPSLELVW